MSQSKANKAVSTLQRLMEEKNAQSAIDIRREKLLQATQQKANKALKKLYAKLAYMFLEKVTPTAENVQPVLIAFLAEMGINARSHNLKSKYEFSPFNAEKGERRSKEIKFSNAKGQKLLVVEICIQFKDAKQSNPSVTAYIGTVSNK